LKADKSVGEIVFGARRGSDSEDSPDNILPEWAKYKSSGPSQWIETLKNTKGDGKPLQLRRHLHTTFTTATAQSRDDADVPNPTAFGGQAAPSHGKLQPRPPKRKKGRNMFALATNERFDDKRLDTVNLKKMSDMVDMKLTSLRHNAMEYNNFMKNVEAYRQQRMLESGVSAIQDHSQRMKERFYEAGEKEKRIALRAEDLRKRLMDTQCRKRDRVRMEAEKMQQMIGKREQAHLQSKRVRAFLTIVALAGLRKEHLEKGLDEQRKEGKKRPVHERLDAKIETEGIESLSARILQRAWTSRSSLENGRSYRNALKVRKCCWLI
jgi:hypothetical protein